MTSHPEAADPAIDPAIERIYQEWDRALGAKDLDAAMALYHENCTLESPLVCHLLRTTDGVVSGRDALRAFVQQVFDHQPAERRRFRSDLLSDGRRVMWEYPRQSPEGDQMDITEVMEIDHGRITSHRVYWGWKAVGMLLRDEHDR